MVLRIPPGGISPEPAGPSSGLSDAKTPKQGFVIGTLWLALLTFQLVVWAVTQEPLSWWNIVFITLMATLGGSYLASATMQLGRARAGHRG